MSVTIRIIEPRDNAGVEALIRTCLIEFGANHAGTAWTDPDLGRYTEVYSAPDSRYWVAVDETGAVVGGVGVGPLPGADGVCELQKMYCLPAYRGTGIAHRLMELALSFAAAHYAQCYLETLSNMVAAQKFYAKYGFRRVEAPPVPTPHFACDVRLLRDLGDLREVNSP